MKSLFRISLLLLFVCSCSNNSSVAVSDSWDSSEEKEPAGAISSTYSTSDVSKSTPPRQKETKSINSKSKETIPQEPSERKETTIKEKEGEQVSSAQKKISDLIARLKNDRAATKEEIAVEEELMMEITGLIFEQTMTKIGYEFYEYFFMLWEAPPEAADKEYNIYISERASPLWGSWIDVSIDSTTVWSSVLRPRSVEIEDAVAEAIAVTQLYFQSSPEDQGRIEELVGTGI